MSRVKDPRVTASLWVPPLAFTLLLWGTVGWVRPIAEMFRSRGLLSSTLWAISALLVGSFVLLWWKKQVIATTKKLEILSGLGWIGTGLFVYGIAMTHFVVAPEERMHFMLIGLATYLYERLFRARWPESKFIPVLAFLAGTGVGLIEEGLQTLYPTRYFDWRDVGINMLAAFLATLMISLTLERRKRHL